MGKNICKNISKNVGGKNSQNPLDHAKESAADALKTASQRAIQKIAKATGDFIGEKIADTYKNCATKRSLDFFASR